MGGAESIEIEVAYASPARQRIVSLRVDAGTTAADAVRLSGLIREFPEIALETAKIGIHGRRVTYDHPVSAGDRVEIYRPLVADPKKIRRQRAERAQSSGPAPRG